MQLKSEAQIEHRGETWKKQEISSDVTPDTKTYRVRRAVSYQVEVASPPMMFEASTQLVHKVGRLWRECYRYKMDKKLNMGLL